MLRLDRRSLPSARPWAHSRITRLADYFGLRTNEHCLQQQKHAARPFVDFRFGFGSGDGQNVDYVMAADEPFINLRARFWAGSDTVIRRGKPGFGNVAVGIMFAVPDGGFKHAGRLARLPACHRDGCCGVGVAVLAGSSVTVTRLRFSALTAAFDAKLRDNGMGPRPVQCWNRADPWRLQAGRNGR